MTRFVEVHYECSDVWFADLETAVNELAMFFRHHETADGLEELGGRKVESLHVGLRAISHAEHWAAAWITCKSCAMLSG